jgi:hypothetical protein
MITIPRDPRVEARDDDSIQRSVLHAQGWCWRRDARSRSSNKEINMSIASPLPTFEHAAPLGENDSAFLQEVATVFERYGNIDRFGLCMLHEHFPVADDEILMETHDSQARTHAVRTIKRSDIGDAKDTMWRIRADDGAEPAFQAEALMACEMDKCK